MLGAIKHEQSRHWQHWEDKKEDEDNPQTLATMGRQERGRRQAKYKNTAQ
jgi:hypothetical protein